MDDNNTIDKAKDIYIKMKLSVDDNKHDFLSRISDALSNAVQQVRARVFYSSLF